MLNLLRQLAVIIILSFSRWLSQLILCWILEHMSLRMIWCKNFATLLVYHVYSRITFLVHVVVFRAWKILNSIFPTVLLKHLLNASWKWSLLSLSRLVINHHLLLWLRTTTGCEFLLVLVDGAVVTLLFNRTCASHSCVIASLTGASLSIDLSFWSRLHLVLSLSLRTHARVIHVLFATCAANFAAGHFGWALKLLHLCLINILLRIFTYIQVLNIIWCSDSCSLLLFSAIIGEDILVH